MNQIGPNNTFGTPTYGPFQDGTVQTYFSYSPTHPSPYHPYPHQDLMLKKPDPIRDQVIHRWDGLPVNR